MDLDYLLFLQEIRQSLPPCVEHFFATLSAINVHPLLFTIPFIIYWCVDKRRGQILLTAVWLGNILNFPSAAIALGLGTRRLFRRGGRFQAQLDIHSPADTLRPR